MSYKWVSIVVGFDEDELGEMWMNEDNMRSLLYSETATDEDLLFLGAYYEYDDKEDDWVGSEYYNEDELDKE